MPNPLVFSHRIWRRGLRPLCLLIYLLISFCNSPVVSERQAYRTAYGCEGATLSITCEPGHVINVIRANYGRFSITICNSHGNTDWSVNCHSPRTHRVLDQRCSGNNGCRIDVSSELFGDPCPGTLKYIEVHYNCGLATTTTTTVRPRPPWFIKTKEPVWLPSNVNVSSVTTEAFNSSYYSSSMTPKPFSLPSTQPTPTTTTATTTTSPRVSISTESTTAASFSTFRTTVKSSDSPSHSYSSSSVHKSISSNQNWSDKNKQSGSENVFVQHPTQRSIYSSSTSWNEAVKALPVTTPAYDSNLDIDSTWCSPTFARGLNWNWTRSGETAVLVCPGGATGTAKRKCLLGKWEASADLSECRSAWLTALNKRANTQDSVLAVATDLAKVTASKALYGGDLITAARLIKTLSRRMMQDVTSAFPEPQQRQALVTEFLLASLETGSALLSAGLIGPWGDLSPKERRYAVTELMVGLEEAAFLLGDVLPRATQAIHFKSHILTSVRAVAADGSSVRFPSADDENSDWVFTDSVVLAPEAVLENSEGSSTRVVFFTYRHLEDLLALENDNFEGSRRRNISLIVNSRVVSASLGHGRHIQLPEPVTITFSLLKQDNVSNPICAFWDYTTHSWSDEGCFVHSFNRTHVTCKCDHLTNFAVVMEEISTEYVEEGASSLRILAYVGCFFCILCVAAYIVIFTVFRGSDSSSASIRRHVCICTLIAELAFLIGVWRTDLPVFCEVTAAVLHYSVLATFVWMCLEGFQIYLSVTRPEENGDVTSLCWWHYIICYGAPLLVVCSAAIVDPSSFGTSDYCWLRADNYFVFSLVGPALVLALLEVAVLGGALVRVCRFNPDEDLKAKKSAKLASSRIWLRSASILLMMIVLTWSLGLLLLYQPSLSLAIGFCICNSILGSAIFINQFLGNQKVLEWCCVGSSEEQRNAAATLPQFFRSVFVAEKQTYSPNMTAATSTTVTSNNNGVVVSANTTPSLFPEPLHDSCTPHSRHAYPNPHPHLHPHQHHQANGTLVSKSLNHAFASSPSLQQLLPTLFHVGVLKNSRNPITAPFHGGTSIAGSRGSLRQLGSPMAYPIPMGSLHQSLPRNRIPPSAGATTPLQNGTLNAPQTLADEDASYKSSRDSGHGGSEQEDSPRTPWMGHRAHAHPGIGVHTLSADFRGGYVGRGIIVPNNYSLSLAPNSSLTPAVVAMLRAGGHRAQSPWNHTYMEIETEADPVYEEIERERWMRSGGGAGGSEAALHQVSDLSDEEPKRPGPPSDVSRHSSRSYGDSRPLLSQLQHQRRPSRDSQFALSEERLRDFNAAQMSRDLEHLHSVQRQLSRENLMTVAVLNGEQVVCRLSSPSQQPPQQYSPGPQGLPVIHEGANALRQGGLSLKRTDYPGHLVIAQSHDSVLMNEC